MANHFLSRSLHTPASSCSLHRFALALAASILIVTTGCSTESLRSITVTPAPNTEVLSGSGQTFQYKATGYYQQGSHPADARDITSSVTWTSGNTSVATVSSTGLVTSVGAGTAVITATAKDSSSISGASNVTVTVTGTTGSAARTLNSIQIIPNSASLVYLGETTQFLAIGTYSAAPITQDLTNLVTWNSSDVTLARINAAGLATSTSGSIQGSTTTITALYTPAPSTSAPNPATIVGTATLSLLTPAPVTLPTLTLYKVGLNATLGNLTATYTVPGTTNQITLTCGPGSTVAACTNNVPVNSVVTITTTNKGNSPTFGGWSSNCTVSMTDPYTCTVTMSVPGTQSPSIGNVTVGAIFD